MDAVFVTNTRGLDISSNQNDRKLVYRDLKNWQKSTFNPPNLYSWQDVILEYAGFRVSCRIFVIGSTATDIINNKISKFRVAKKQIQTAIQVAEKLGARVICFGAATKKVAELFIQDGKLPVDVICSNGDTLTAGFAKQEIEKMAKKCALDLNIPSTKIAIVGAYGKIGSALVKSLARDYKAKLILIGPSLPKLKNLANQINYCGREIELLVDFNLIREKINLLITATNHPNSIVDVKRLISNKAPILSCDISQPRNISKTICDTMSDKLISWEACILENKNLQYSRAYGMGLDINGIKGKIKSLLGFKSHRAFACLAETLILAMAQLLHPETIKGRSFIGKVNIDNIEPLMKLAKIYGFKSRYPESYGKKISGKQFLSFAKQLEHTDQILLHPLTQKVSPS